MTAYIHIGNWKTGSTTIQNFLTLNYNNLINLGFLYPKTLGMKINHPLLLKISREPKISKLYILNLKKEIKKSGCKNIIFSHEDLVLLVKNINYLYELKNFLIYSGFNKIYIILYIRDTYGFLNSLCSQEVRACHLHTARNTLAKNFGMKNLFDYKTITNSYSQVFGKENLIIKLFDKNEFYQGDLLKDFLNVFNIKMDGSFIKPNKEIKNKSLDLLGIELMTRLRKYLDFPWLKTQKIYNEYFTSNDPCLKFQPPKEIMQSYIDYFEESNEWVRKEFFPHKERLFPKKDLSNYKENYELKEMKPEYWDKIAEFIADIVKTKNQNIYSKYDTAKSRIQNQLSYKLGQAMIANSKSFLGYIRMPFVLSYIYDKHKQEQKIYQEKIKKDSSLVLLPLESYPDYKEALKEKECLTYKLGQALIQANKLGMRGGVYQIAV
ncbi:hypothetical protein CAQ16704_0318 [Campylobacter sp. RM16704]|nr:hypothetical protein [Campylobacter sp. RM16704]AJC85827.1 hypothetical protein CAQ16704_0318 [Campylobacter sp. RM16704]